MRTLPILIPDWNPSWSETVWEPSFVDRLSSLEFDLVIGDASTANRNLAIDETLLYRVAEGARRPIFRLWDWSERAVILGSYQSVRNEIDRDVAGAKGFTFARRISGGGAMMVEPGRTITYSLIVPEGVVEGLSFRQSFAFLDRWCVQALRALDIPASYRPVNDIVSPSGKIAGAAQCRRKKTVLHHVTMACEMDGDLMHTLLRHGKDRSGKGIASAEKTVSPLRMFTTRPIEELRDHFLAVFSSLFTVHRSRVMDDERQDADQRERMKFSTREWLFRVE